MSAKEDRRSFRKKSYGRSKRDVGLPFPNFGLGKTELPTICRCYCSFEDDDTCTSSTVGGNGNESNSKGSKGKKYKFFVTHQVDMLTLYINGSFGTSSLTYRSPSFMSDVPFEDQRYYRKLKERRKQQSAMNDKHYLKSTSVNSNGFGIGSRADVDEEDKLLLLAEEVVFLSFGVGCLSLHSYGSEVLSYEYVWKKLVKKNPEFPFLYAVYHYFRSKNWVPKSGFQLGGDYVLYEVGPDSHHAAYVVHIIGLPSRPKPTWTELYSWQRVASGSNKQALLCEIHPPRNFVPENTTPRSIFGIKIRETVIERWVPFATRLS